MDPLSAARDAVALARLQRDGKAWLVVSRRVDLPADPLAAFAAADGCGRILLWRPEGWQLAIGTAADASADGPGRHMAMAQAIARGDGRCVVHAPDGPHDLPCLMHLAAFADAPADAVWPGVAGAHIRLPRRLLWRERDVGWRIDAAAVRADDTPATALARLEAEPPAVERAPAQPWPALRDDYRALVEDAVSLIADGALRKVVVARAVDAAWDGDLLATLHRLRSAGDDDTTVYAVDLEDGACFAGATPELLFSAEGARVRTMALAGSCRRGADAAEDAALGAALFASTKERKEHQLVVEHLATVLRPRCRPFALPPAPELRRLPRLLHLQTPLAVELLRADYPELLGAVHPTPAVCGLPVASATRWIARHEHLGRGLWSGALGWLTAGRCAYAVALRGGVLRGRDARLFAGAGVVETSDPEAEYAETEGKMAVMRGALS